jgi:acyl dehydratase
MADPVVSQWMKLLPLALRRAPGLHDGADIPRIEVGATVPVDASWLRAYRAVTGGVDDGVLPPCAPQVLATGLHMKILGDDRYPLPVLGMVHLENVIEETRPIPASSTLELRAVLQGHQRVARGVTVEIVTEAHVGGVLAWRSVLTALVRDKVASGEKKPREERKEEAERWASSSSVSLPEDLGRRYARISGDANPIHWNRFTAKPFGFPRAIIHGMWTLARSLVEVDAVVVARPRRIHARFIRPVFLPGAMVVTATTPSAERAVFLRVTPLRAGPPHMLASVEPLVAPRSLT